MSPRAFAFAAALCVAACGPTKADLEELKNEAAGCVFGDACVLAGGNQCTCPAPVNERRRDEVDELASRIDCGNELVECPTLFNLRCESGRCTATGSE